MLESDRPNHTLEEQVDLVPKIEITYNSFEDYCEIFRVSLESLEGKRVLDVGAGVASFVPTLLDAGVDAYAVDPRFHAVSPDKLIEDLEKVLTDRDLKHPPKEELERFKRSIATHPDRYVQTYATELPFTNGDFDLIVSNLLMYRHLIKLNAFDVALEEFLRVTKSGGRIKIHEVPGTPSPPMRTMLDHVESYIGIRFPELKRRTQNGTIDQSLTDEEMDNFAKFRLYSVLLALENKDIINPPRFFDSPVSKEEDQMVEIRKRVQADSFLPIPSFSLSTLR